MSRAHLLDAVDEAVAAGTELAEAWADRLGPLDFPAPDVAAPGGANRIDIRP